MQSLPKVSKHLLCFKHFQSYNIPSHINAAWRKCKQLPKVRYFLESCGFGLSSYNGGRGEGGWATREAQEQWNSQKIEITWCSNYYRQLPSISGFYFVTSDSCLKLKLQCSVNVELKIQLFKAMISLWHCHVIYFECLSGEGHKKLFSLSTKIVGNENENNFWTRQLFSAIDSIHWKNHEKSWLLKIEKNFH